MVLLLNRTASACFHRFIRFDSTQVFLHVHNNTHDDTAVSGGIWAELHVCVNISFVRICGFILCCESLTETRLFQTSAELLLRVMRTRRRPACSSLSCDLTESPFPGADCGTNGLQHLFGVCAKTDSTKTTRSRAYDWSTSLPVTLTRGRWLYFFYMLKSDKLSFRAAVVSNLNQLFAQRSRLADCPPVVILCMFSS